MSYPKVIIDLNKIEKNVRAVTNLCSAKDIDVAGVTKVFCGNPEIARAYVDGGVKYLADSRLENFEKLKDLDIPKMMLRLPMISEVDDIVRLTDISLNSEVSTIKELSRAALEQGKLHDIILMVDLGDLREGYFLEEELFESIEKIIDLEGIRIAGIGTNMACYGGVVPEKSSMDRLEEISSRIEKEFDIELEIMSNGNSSTFHLLDKDQIGNTNNLRLGECLVVGTEPSCDTQIEGTVRDAFVLEAEIIELKEKPSLPVGKIGKDAFGNIPSFEDKGIRKRMICAIGKQDIDHGSLIPLDEGVSLLGGSSDHLIVDGTDSEIDYKVGDLVRFRLEYVSILRAMTSEYVTKEIIRG